jgi:hypothetical protein
MIDHDGLFNDRADAVSNVLKDGNVLLYWLTVGTFVQSREMIVVK